MPAVLPQTVMPFGGDGAAGFGDEARARSRTRGGSQMRDAARDEASMVSSHRDSETVEKGSQSA